MYKSFRTGGKTMRRKRIVCIAVIVILIITGVVIITRDYRRTNEEYMAILTDNQEDFEYVARTMQQFSSGSIHFHYGRHTDFDNISSNNPEIEDEISNNADFYKSLNNLYELGEIGYIINEEEYGIMFHFRKFPQNYHGGVAYGGIERDWPAIPIDDNWVLKMIPNI